MGRATTVLAVIAAPSSGALFGADANPAALGRQPRFLPTPRVLALRDKPSVFQLLDSEVSVIPGVYGLKARKLALLCGYEGYSEMCDVDGPTLPAPPARWTTEAASNGLVACGVNLARGGGGLMPALARVCAARGSKLTYHTLPLPEWLRDEPTSYLAAALKTGCVELVEHANTAEYNAFRASAAATGAGNFVPHGGQWAVAEPGIAALARAIGTWWKTRPGGGLEVPRQLTETARGLDVVLPAGTGTTALFLARHAPPGVVVYAIPCNGTPEQLRSRMTWLDSRTGGYGLYPEILPPPPSHTVPFGKVAAPLLTTWRDAANAGVFLDLVYGPVAWAAMEACGWRPSEAGQCAEGEHEREAGRAAQRSRDLLYINTGGHDGLDFQLGRYLRAGYLNRYEWADGPGKRVGGQTRQTCVGQWTTHDVIASARRVAAAQSGLVHTRDAGL